MERFLIYLLMVYGTCNSNEPCTEMQKACGEFTLCQAFLCFCIRRMPYTERPAGLRCAWLIAISPARACTKTGVFLCFHIRRMPYTERPAGLRCDGHDSLFSHVMYILSLTFLIWQFKPIDIPLRIYYYIYRKGTIPKTRWLTFIYKLLKSNLKLWIGSWLLF